MAKSRKSEQTDTVALILMVGYLAEEADRIGAKLAAWFLRLAEAALSEGSGDKRH